MDNPNAGANTGPIFDSAFKRSLIGSAIAGLGTFFTLLPQTDDWKLIVSGAGAAALGVLGARFGIEGVYDANRAKSGNINDADVPVASNATTVITN